MNDFYVGYLPKAPTALAGFVRKIVIVLGTLAMIMALVLVVAQKPFANSAFEYGELRSFEGVVEAATFPNIVSCAPGRGRATGQIFALSAGRARKTWSRQPCGQIRREPGPSTRSTDLS